MTRKLATDHRALVLESVATSPFSPSIETIVKDCVGAEFTRKMIRAMVWQLRREGLIGLQSSGTSHFITKAGLEYLTGGRFDRALPERGTPRPKARRRSVSTGDK